MEDPTILTEKNDTNTDAKGTEAPQFKEGETSAFDLTSSFSKDAPLEITNREANSSTKDAEEHNIVIPVISVQKPLSRESSGVTSNESHMDKEQKVIEADASAEKVSINITGTPKSPSGSETEHNSDKLKANSGDRSSLEPKEVTGKSKCCLVIVEGSEKKIIHHQKSEELLKNIEEHVNKQNKAEKSSSGEKGTLTRKSSGSKKDSKKNSSGETEKKKSSKKKKEEEIFITQDDLKVRSISYDKNAENKAIPRATSPQPEKRSKFSFFHKNEKIHEENEKKELSRKGSFFSNLFRRETKEQPPPPPDEELHHVGSLEEPSKKEKIDDQKPPGKSQSDSNAILENKIAIAIKAPKRNSNDDRKPQASYSPSNKFFSKSIFSTRSLGTRSAEDPMVSTVDEKKEPTINELVAQDVTLDCKTMEDLPKDLQRLLKNTKIATEQITPENFELLLNVLHFQTKLKFKSIEDRKRQLKHDHSKMEMPPPKTKSPRPIYDLDLLINPGDPRETYKLDREEGKGGFGTVFRGFRKDDHKGKHPLAIKVMQHNSEKERKFNIAELSCLKFCKHPNIVNYICSYKVNTEIWSILEFLEGGTLDQAVKSYNFQEKQIAYVAREMLQGMAYLHSENLVHRDLKSSNVMMSIKGDIKLIDFGLCVDISDGVKRTSIVGSPLYIPPEMFRREPHTTAVDIWSFGICLMELANGHPPFQKSTIKGMFTACTEGYPDPFEKPKLWSSSFKDFISKCLQMNPNNRPTSAELLKHEFLQRADNAKTMQQILTGIFILQQVLPF